MAVAQSSSPDVLNVFKKVYGDIHDLTPDGFPILEMLPFSEGAKVGDAYKEAVVLTAETGWTLGGSGGDLINIQAARAGTVKQTNVVPYTSVLASLLPWQVISRSAGGGEKAFKAATKQLVGNNIKSHFGLAETMAMYGQADALLGYVSYATATYRGVSFTNGTGTLGGVAFTNGINAASKAILLAPGSFASGIWVGKEGCLVNQVNSSAAIVATGSLVSVDSENGILYVDFTPVAASSTTSHRLCFDGMESQKEMIGINKILSNTGTLFDISAATYSLWKGTQVNLNNTLLTFAKMQSAAAQALNRAGFEGEICWKVNPRSFATLVNAEAARRMYDSSYGPAKFENGAEEIEFYYAGGKMTVKGSRYVKEGEAYGLVKETWVRSGSAQIGFKIPGMEGRELINQVENSTAYSYRSYADQYIFCRKPAQNILVTGINDEASA